MTDQEKVEELITLLEYIKEELDHVCCQSLMDADGISQKISEKIKEIKE